VFCKRCCKLFCNVNPKVFSKMFAEISTKATSSLLGGCLLIASFYGSVHADITISTTIRPLHFIALAIVGEQGEVTALIDSKSSPHHFNLTPSDRVELLRSDLIVWVGPELEGQLSNSLSKVAASDRIITTIALPGLISHKIGSEDQIDAHIWLDTRNALLIATEIAQQAKRLDPENSEYFESNLKQFQLGLNRATDKIKLLFNPSNVKPFAVYHNGFQYFEKQFGLSHQLELVTDPEIAPTIAEIINTRKEVAALKPLCLFGESDANPELVRTMLSDYRRSGLSHSSSSSTNLIQEVTIDLLGNGIAESPLAYTDLITHVADEFSSCLNTDTVYATNNR
jgi:zinc transport system substrate-binding protein